MRHFLFISVIAALLASNGCKPDEPVVGTVDCTECGPYMLGEVEDYLFFQPGSWWVYRNTANGELDTLMMKSSSKRMRKIIGEKRSISYEHIDFELISKTNQARYTYTQITPFPDPAAPYRHKVWIDRSRTNPYVGHTQPFAWADYYKPGMVVGGGSGNDTRFIQEHDTLVLGDSTYFDVLQFETTDDFSFVYGTEHWENGGPTSYYWAKDVGLIKNKSLRFAPNWELVSYSLEK